MLAAALEQDRDMRRGDDVPRPAIFFDIDGVLNEDAGGHGIVHEDQVVLLPGAGEALRRTHQAGRLAVGITNRPQIAKGLITREGLDRILDRLQRLLAADEGHLDRIFFCPHYPGDGHPGEVTALITACSCRKPQPGLLLDAARDLNIDLAASALIGDSMRDIAAARAAGVAAYGVQTGYGCADGFKYSAVSPELPPTFATVLDAVNHIIARNR